MTNYLLTGGGTAGHVNPLLTVADALRDRDPKAKVYVLGTQSGLESRLVPAAGYELLIIDRLPFPRRIGFSALLFPFKIRKATRRVRQLLKEKQIDVVIGFGGYVSAPAYLAARQSRVPIVIHEANALPGIANRLGNRFAAAAGKAFRSADMANTEFVGMPIRKSIVALATNRDRAKARKHFGLDPDGFTLLVTGGSLGAASINKTIEESRAILKAAGIQVLHIVGEKSELSEISEPDFCRVRYVDQMELAMAAANFAVARAGAATVSEFSAIGLPALYIPYPVGNGEQRFNIQDVLAAGGAITVTDNEFTREFVRSTLIPLLSDSKKLEAMALASSEAGALDGTERFIALIDEVVSRR